MCSHTTASQARVPDDALTPDNASANTLANAPSPSFSGLPIGPDLPWLAPLAGFSDLPFRLLCRELGAAVACTEMVSAKGLILGQGKRSGATESYLITIPPPHCDAPHQPTPPCAEAPQTTPPQGPRPGDRVRAAPQDRPLVVQLFGSEAPFLEKAVRTLAERGYQWFDLNMGCSVPKVGKSGSGSAMLRDIPNALAVARAMINAAGPGKVGFKLRLGWQQGEEVYLDLARRLEELGAGWVTLHPRYARQKFSGTADWSHTARLKEALSIPVIAGGDLFTARDAVRCLEETGADSVMFARGALNNPAV
ncbi:tRNA-dihydrouridine synthase family protein, partial [Desulfovibrio sp. OttesenSCG-928-I05]|nr:tRNA-dihydrouridine synthase family protein [Desulfovibrio sp. OttesenSCG-928-I05]